MPRHPDDTPETRPPADAGVAGGEVAEVERAALGLVPGPDTPPGDSSGPCLRLPPRLRVTGPRVQADPGDVCGARGGGGGRRAAAPVAPPPRTDTPLSAADRPDQAIEDGWGDRHRPAAMPGTAPDDPPPTDGRAGRSTEAAAPPGRGKRPGRSRAGARPGSSGRARRSPERPTDGGHPPRVRPPHDSNPDRVLREPSGPPARLIESRGASPSAGTRARPPDRPPRAVHQGVPWPPDGDENERKSARRDAWPDPFAPPSSEAPAGVPEAPDPPGEAPAGEARPELHVRAAEPRAARCSRIAPDRPPDRPPDRSAPGRAPPRGCGRHDGLPEDRDHVRGDAGLASRVWNAPGTIETPPGGPPSRGLRPHADPRGPGGGDDDDRNEGPPRLGAGPAGGRPPEVGRGVTPPSRAAPPERSVEGRRERELGTESASRERRVEGHVDGAAALYDAAPPGVRPLARPPDGRLADEARGAPTHVDSAPSASVVRLRPPDRADDAPHDRSRSVRVARPPDQGDADAWRTGPPGESVKVQAPRCDAGPPGPAPEVVVRQAMAQAARCAWIPDGRGLEDWLRADPTSRRGRPPGLGVGTLGRCYGPTDVGNRPPDRGHTPPDQVEAHAGPPQPAIDPARPPAHPSGADATRPPGAPRPRDAEVRAGIEPPRGWSARHGPDRDLVLEARRRASGPERQNERALWASPGRGDRGWVASRPLDGYGSAAALGSDDPPGLARPPDREGSRCGPPAGQDSTGEWGRAPEVRRPDEVARSRIRAAEARFDATPPDRFGDDPEPATAGGVETRPPDRPPERVPAGRSRERDAMYVAGLRAFGAWPGERGEGGRQRGIGARHRGARPAGIRLIRPAVRCGHRPRPPPRYARRPRWKEVRRGAGRGGDHRPPDERPARPGGRESCATSATRGLVIHHSCVLGGHQAAEVRIRRGVVSRRSACQRCGCSGP